MKTKDRIATHINSNVIGRVNAQCKSMGLNASQISRCVAVALDSLERGYSAVKSVDKALVRAKSIKGVAV
jgi:hypothetical protein